MKHERISTKGSMMTEVGGRDLMVGAERAAGASLVFWRGLREHLLYASSFTVLRDAGRMV